MTPDPFIDRLREAFVDLSEADIDTFQGAAQSASANLGANQAIALVRRAYGQEVAAEAEDNLRTRLNADAEVVGAEGRSQLVRVLAGEALILLFGRLNYNRGLLAAFAIRCAHHVGWRPVHPDLETVAEAYLKVRAVQNRAHMMNSFALAGKASSEEAPWTATSVQLTNLTTQLNAARHAALERDELGWWLAADSRPSTALATAAEFNSCLRYYPEPFSTDELLKSKLGKSVSNERWTPIVPIPNETISAFCPSLSGELDDVHAEEELSLRAVRSVLDQIILAQLYANSQEK
jgi:hypothetical protein